MLKFVCFALSIIFSFPNFANAGGDNTCYTPDQLRQKMSKGFTLKPWEKMEAGTKEVITYFGGPGLEIAMDIDEPKPRWLDVAHVIGGFAGYKAGIRKGDHIIKVDGRPVSDFADDAAIIAAIRGKVGTIVVLTIDRGESVFDARVKRQVVPNFKRVDCVRVVKTPSKGA